MTTLSRTLTLTEVRDRAAMEQCWALRRQIFIEEQGVPEAIEMDENDARAYHVLATIDGVVVGCGRMVPHGGEVKIGRMAVLAERREHGIGRRIIEHLMDAARERGYRKAILHAQLYAEGFYLKCGYEPVGAVFEEAGIPHRLMERDL